MSDHGSKLTEFYVLVESYSPGSYLELFARGERPGWVVWGESAERPLKPVQPLQLLPTNDTGKPEKPATGRA